MPQATKQDFEAAATRAKAFTSKPSNDDLLKLYSLYKQATVGDNETEKPGFFDFKASAKWTKWAELKGTPPRALTLLLFV